MMTTRKLLLLAIMMTLGAQTAYAKPREVTLGKTQRAHLNVFFSNFAEVQLPTFARGDLTNQAMIDFGVLHRILNNEKMLRSNGAGKWKLAASDVASASMYYFGDKPTSWRSSKHAPYRNGYFYGEYSAGDTYNFAEVSRVWDLGRGLFRADVNIMEPQSMDDTKGVRVARRRALIRKISNRYLLVEYQPLR